MKKQTEGKKVKKLPLDQSSFPANGKTYYFQEMLSVDRYMKFQELQPMVGFGIQFDELYDQLSKAYSKLNDSKYADAVVVIHNLLTMINRHLEKRYNPALMIAALFMNYEGEDETVYDEGVILKKIDDWRAEGYNMQDFFGVACTLVPRFLDVYTKDLESILSHTQKQANTVSKEKK